MNAPLFASSLLITVLLLLAVVVTGLRARRRAHLSLVAAAVVMLGVTIFFAERLGDEYDLEAAGWITPLHLTLAKIATACYLLPVITGLRVLRRPQALRWHRRVAFLVLTLTVLTALTGTWMLFASDPLP